MKQQGSLITTLLVILESLAVVGFLFLTFAVSSSSNIGKYEYEFKVNSRQDVLKPLSQAVVLADDQGKSHSFNTDDSGTVRFRSKHPLEMITISASEHFTQSFELNDVTEDELNKEVYVLESVAKETLKTLTQVVRAVSIVNEDDQPITDGVITVHSETPARSFQYDPTQEAYDMVIRNADEPILFSVSAPGYVPQFNVTYNEQSPTVVLEKQPNLNLPFQFTVSVYDSESNAEYSNLDDPTVASDAGKPVSKKALDIATLSVDQGAVIKNALGTFQVFSRQSENEIQVHAPQYQSHQLVLKSDEQDENHYRVFLKKDQDAFAHKLMIKTYDDQKNAMSTAVQTEANAAIQKDTVGVYRVFTNDPKLAVMIEAPGFVSQKLMLFPEKQTDYQVALKLKSQLIYSLNVEDNKKKPIERAVVTLLASVPQSKQTNKDGLASIATNEPAQEALLVAPGYLSRTVTLPKAQKNGIVRANFALEKDPMASITQKIRVQVQDSNKKALAASVSSSAGFVSQEKLGNFLVMSPTRNMRLNVSALGYVDQEIDVSQHKKNSITVSMKKLGQQLTLMDSAKYNTQVSVLDERGKRFNATVASTEGFVRQKKKGVYQIFSPSKNLVLNVSAAGYEHQTIGLTGKNFKKEISVTLKKLNAQVQEMAEAQHTLRVLVQDKNKKAVEATVVSNSGFVQRKQAGKFQIFSASQRLDLNVTAPGYQEKIIKLTPKSFKSKLTVVLKEEGEQLRLMADAKQKLQVQVLDENQKPLAANVVSNMGFVTQEKYGVYQIFSANKDLTLSISAPGYNHETISLSEKTHKSPLKVALRQVGEQVQLISSADRSVQVKVLNDKGKPLVANVSSNNGFVKQEQFGTYTIFSSAAYLKVNISASGYQEQQIDLSPKTMKDSVTVSMKKVEEHLGQMASAKHKVQVHILDEKGRPLEANISSNVGFVTHKKAGIYRVFSPSRSLMLNVSAPGYEHQKVDLDKKSFKDTLKISLKPQKAQLQMMASANQQMEVKVVDDKGNPVPATVSSSQGFVSQDQIGSYRIFSPSQDIKVSVSAFGYESQNQSITAKNFKSKMVVALKKIDEQVEMMASSEHFVRVKVSDKQKQLLPANISSTAGFVKQEQNGIYRVYSPTQDLTLNISAKGYEQQLVTLSPKNFKKALQVTLKKLDERVEMMTSANHEVRVQVTDSKGFPLIANVSSDYGFVRKRDAGKFQIFSGNSTLKLEISAQGYKGQSLILSPQSTKKTVKVALQKVKSQVGLMASANHEIQVKVVDQKGKRLPASIASTLGFVNQEQNGVYRVFSPSKDLSLNVAAPGYEHQTVTLTNKTFKDALKVTLKRQDQRIEQMESAKHVLRVKVLDEKKKKMLATVSSSAGFVQRQSNGIYQVFSPTQDIEVTVDAPGYIHEKVSLSEETFRKSLTISLMKEQMSKSAALMAKASHTLDVEVFDENKKPINANVASSLGFVNQRRNGFYKIFTPSYDMRVSVIAPGYAHQTFDLTKHQADKPLKVFLQKTDTGVVLNTEVGDRLILSKGVVYRVVQPIDEKTVRVFRRTDPKKGEFNDFPEGQVMGIQQFNREIQMEKSEKNFYDENVWVTVYALDKKEYFLFKDVYRKQWADYKLVYANHR